MRCSQSTSELTDRQTARATASANTFSVDFGKRNRQSGGLDHAAATRGESGYPHP
ncbi:hypothetical protein [Haloarcula sediminis]|uniref:hypothetical protein n=1 Tax=Haloarcula sediminis TaxID=3111777 RepID=UPI002D797F92|nr:hypothetical protein [Haloarcula sp. CK38]